MNDKYDLDQILAEIKKKQGADDGTPETAPEAELIPPQAESGKFTFDGVEADSVPASVSDDALELDSPAQEDGAIFEDRFDGTEDDRFVLNMDIDDAIRGSAEPPDMQRTEEFHLPPQFSSSSFSADSAEELISEPTQILDPLPLASQEEGSIEEYTQPQDAPSIQEDLHGLRSSLTLRMVLTLLIFVGLAYLVASTVMPLPMPEMISVKTMPAMFVGANLVLTAAAVLINNGAVGSGLLSLFKLKANNDSLVAFACLAAVAHGTALVVNPQAMSTGAANLYFPLAVLGLLFNTIGKIMYVDRIAENFKIISADFQKYAAVKTTSDERISFTGELDPQEQDVVYFGKTKFLGRYLGIAYNEEYVEKNSRRLTPVVVVASLLVGVVTYFITKDVFAALSAFAALACISAPFTTAMVGNLPMARASRELYKQGTCISGFEAVEQFGETDTVLLGSMDLFPQGTVQMHGMKAFNNERIDEAIVEAASIACEIDSPLQHVFLPVINKQKAMMRRVEKVTVEDALGVAAKIGGKTVRMGSREMMDRYGIMLPSMDQEEKLKKDGREVLYVARESRLSAVFVLSYNADEDAGDTLYELLGKGIHVVVCATDPFITVERIKSLFELEEDDEITLMGDTAVTEYTAMTQEKASADAYLCSTHSPMALAKALLSTERVRSAVNLGWIMQIISMVLGLGIVGFFAFTGSIVQLGAIPVLGYQLLWTLIIVFANAVRRY